MRKTERKDDPPGLRPEPMPAWAGGPGRRRKRQPYVPPRWSVGRLVPLVAVALLLVWVVSPPGLPSGQVSGKSRVVDGDTLDVGKHRIRLTGIDAPERAQYCTDAAQQSVPCGETARQTLADLVGKGPVTCTALDQDRYGRLVATCEYGGADLGAVMVGAGQAVDAGRYAALELEAKAARRGIWAGTFEPPAEWRRTHQVDEAEGAPRSPVLTLINWVGNMFFR